MERLTDMLSDNLIQRHRCRVLAAQIIAPRTMPVGGTMVKTGEDGEIVSVFGDGTQQRRNLIITSDLLRVDRLLMKTKIATNTDQSPGCVIGSGVCSRQ
jgi:hypothetical protein